MDRTMRALQKKLERMELEHLRQHALELYTRLEQAEAAAQQAEFWQQHAMDLQEAINDPDFVTHKCVGITKTGEMIVVRNDEHRTVSAC